MTSDHIWTCTGCFTSAVDCTRLSHPSATPVCHTHLPEPSTTPFYQSRLQHPSTTPVSALVYGTFAAAAHCTCLALASGEVSARSVTAVAYKMKITDLEDAAVVHCTIIYQ
ncbi:uncharacterized protein LOC125378397 [Haliotis rufescens]|uniref:uncharacterized protein LOC125378397 n=1 Tax=Haliotis rufescens TaxID=6454 RepID=UPI00201EA689|nr:uncharacterized protein LOC125378397 [Haliotis rufescens]